MFKSHKLSTFKIAMVGLKAPLFTLNDSEDKLISLSDFKGKKVVVYFFPKSDTPGCTKEACSLRDSNELYKEKGIVVLGISYDSPESLHAFKTKYHLPFIFLSDSTKKVALEYGAYASIINFFYPKRITFLINEEGIITHILDNINVSTHAEDILKLI